MQTAIGVIAGGILFGWIADEQTGWVAGMLLGYLLSKHFLQRSELKQIRERLREVELLLKPGQKAESKEQPVTHENAVTVFHSAAPPQLDEPAPEPKPAPAVAQSEMKPPSRLAAPAPPSWEDRLQAKIIAFFTEGNVVLRVGLLVLFCGVAFLLKYAAEHSVISLEMRLFGVALGGIALLGFGWHQRKNRPGFALLTQGGGIGILYLTIFAAFKLYHLVPLPLAFAVMLGLVATSTALALLQDARSLALFGAAGGFLAPVLLSDGSGNHVALFSYYALLNFGILTISWFKAWRGLNLLGFTFTLGIGTLWGVNHYQPQHFASAEPFLILFFLMFNAIGVLFAFRQPPNLRGYVDGTLVFGTPAICFSLQAGMMHDMPHGLAFSALAVSLFYVGLAKMLWNKGNERLRQGMRTLTEAFLALGIVFVTLAVPLALSGRWTAVTWAMEGAALIWVGIRQNRFLARSCGLLLQFGAGISFLIEGGHISDPHLPVLNGVYLGSIIIALSALFSSWQFYKAENLRPCEKWHHLPLFAWGCLWWFCSGVNEIDQQLTNLPYYYCQDYADLLFIGLSCAAMATLGRHLVWPIAAWPSLALLPLMAAVVLKTWDGYGADRHLFADNGWLAWLMTFSLLLYSLRKARGQIAERCLSITHIGGFLLLTLILSSESHWFLHRFTAGKGVWSFIAWGLIPAAMALLVHSRRLAEIWPLSEYTEAYQQLGSAILCFLLWLWLLAGSVSNPGNATPLPFIPLLNPLELSQLAVMLLLFWWTLRHRDNLTPLPEEMLIAEGAGTMFIWLNTVLARAVHHIADVPFYAESMFHSRLYQAALSILWGLLALALMVAADRRQSRTLWFIGILLIGATVLKLFMVDLAGSGTVERIVSFLSVGIMVIVISYFSPLPPKKEDSA